VFQVEVYAAVRRYVLVEGHSRREAARVFGLSRDTIAKMCRFSVPPGYLRSKPPKKPKLGRLVPVIDAILAADRSAPPKQRHTAKRIFERLRAEYGYPGGYTVVKDYVRLKRVRTKEVFVLLSHPPGHAQVDFGQCIGVIGGVRTVLHVFCFDLPHSDAPFVKAYPAETTEAFLDGHVSAFAFFDGVPQSILYDNTKLAVARILGDVKQDNVAGRQCRCQHLLDISAKPLAVEGALKHIGRADPGRAQAGNKRGQLPAPMRDTGLQPQTARASAIAPGHIGGRPRFVDEDQAIGIERWLAADEHAPGLGYIRPGLLGRV